jgi:hypothetical protein
MMTPPCHSTCERPLYGKVIGRRRLAKDQKELLRKGQIPSPRTTRPIITRNLDFYMVPLTQYVTMVINRVFEQWCADRRSKRVIGQERLEAYYKLVDGVVCKLVYAEACQVSGVYPVILVSPTGLSAF